MSMDYKLPIRETIHTEEHFVFLPRGSLIFISFIARDYMSTFGKLTSLMERKTSMPSSWSGYFNFKFPAAVRTDLTALMP